MIDIDKQWTGLEDMLQDSLPGNWEVSVHFPHGTSRINMIGHNQ